MTKSQNKVQDKLTKGLEISTRSPIISKDIYQNRNIVLVDCRFQFEFRHGHIRNSINISSPLDAQKFINMHSELLNHLDVVEELKLQKFPSHFDLAKLYKLFFTKPAFRESIIIFYCEYSSQRAPNLYNLVRALDREMNKFPELSLPNIFVLEGGFQKFQSLYPHLCSKDHRYVQMLDPRHKGELEVAESNYMSQWAEIGWKLIKY